MTLIVTYRFPLEHVPPLTRTRESIYPIDKKRSAINGQFILVDPAVRLVIKRQRSKNLIPCRAWFSSLIYLVTDTVESYWTFKWSSVVLLKSCLPVQRITERPSPCCPKYVLVKHACRQLDWISLDALTEVGGRVTPVSVAPSPAAAASQQTAPVPSSTDNQTEIVAARVAMREAPAPS